MFPLDWDIAGTGDFNYDGSADILWRNHTTGDVAIWLMNGKSISSGAIVANVPLDWDIAGTGDFNHDGRGTFSGEIIPPEMWPSG